MRPPAVADADTDADTFSNLAFTFFQIDDDNKEVRAFDTRTLRVVERQEYSAPRQGQRGDFNIVDRVPKGGKNEIPTILTAPDVTVTFSCTR